MNVTLSTEIQAKYEVLAVMGEGGMGAVYKVRHRYLDDIQVIKVMREKFQADESFKARFLREAKTAKKLRHPNIAEVIDYSVTADGTAYIVMEFIEGVNLRELVTRSTVPLEPQFVVTVGLQTLSALAYLHEKGFVHRDISPDNLMLAQAGGKHVIKLIDLGIAKSVEGSASLTVDGKFVGKVQYASPEQFGGGDIDQRSDLYSLGVALYELLTGVAPTGGSDYRAIIAAHLTRPPRSFDETDPDGRVPAPLRQIILKALEKDPDNRYPTAEAFAVDLRAIFGNTSDSATVAAPITQSDRQTLVLPSENRVRATTTAPSATTMAMAPVKPRSYRRVFVTAASALVVAAAIVAAVVLFRPAVAVTPPSPKPPVAANTGELVIKGLPWGEIVELTDSAGRSVLPSKPLYTPASVTLAPGSYRVVLSNPVSKRAVRMTAEVRSQTSAVCEAQLDDLDAASYLKEVIP